MPQAKSKSIDLNLSRKSVWLPRQTTRRSIIALILSGILCACATAPPRTPTDACAIFDEKPSWQRAAAKASERWDIPIGVMLAFIKQESSFRHNAKPPRQGRFLLIFPGSRASSAKGYAQALDGSWQDYKEATGRRSAHRTHFADAIDFIGWYNHLSHERHDIAVDDAYSLYLAYHEGHRGYRRGSYKQKPALLAIAQKVAAQAKDYAEQYAECKNRFARPWYRRLF